MKGSAGISYPLGEQSVDSYIGKLHHLAYTKHPGEQGREKVASIFDASRLPTSSRVRVDLKLSPLQRSGLPVRQWCTCRQLCTPANAAKPNEQRLTLKHATLFADGQPVYSRIQGFTGVNPSLFCTPSTGFWCILYAYPMQLQQLVTEPRQGLLPCILHASLHVLVVHIT